MKAQNKTAASSALYPAHQLSVSGNLEEFQIPATPLGRLICHCRLVWGKVEGEVQACILAPELTYPSFEAASVKEVYRA